MSTATDSTATPRRKRRKAAKAEPSRRQRGIVSDKIDRGSPAYRIIVNHGGGPSLTADIIKRSVNTVYGWLSRGQIPAGQQANCREKFADAGKPFPAEWFTERVPAEAA